jgi:hypothetical protein
LERDLRRSCVGHTLEAREKKGSLLQWWSEWRAGVEVVEVEEEEVEAVKKCRIGLVLVRLVRLDFLPSFARKSSMRSKPRGKRAQSPGHGT